MKSYSPKLQVSFDTYQVADAGAHHARRRAAQRDGGSAGPEPAPHLRQRPLRHGRAARRPGRRERRRRRAIPTRARSPPADPNAPLDNLAPGVNDDGSGTALTIELARVFSQSGIEFDATLVFMCHVGEEQGLVGARLHAQKAVAREDSDRGGLQQRHRRQRQGRQRHHRRRDDPRLLGRAGGFAVARARAVRPALGRRATCRRTRCGRWRGPIASAAAATTPPTTSSGSPPSASANRARTSRGSTTCATRSRGSRCRTWRRTRASTRRRPRRWRSRRRRRASLSDRGQPMITRAPSGYDANLRWNAVAGRRRLPHLLARGVGAGLAARPAGRQRHRRDPAEHADRRLRVRRRRGRRRRPRELRHRLRDPAAREHRDQDQAGQP